MAGLSIENVTKRFGETEVLKGVSLDIADGEFVVLVGPAAIMMINGLLSS